MDIEAKPIGNDMWLLTDLLGREVGTIVQTSQGFLIDHDEGSILEGIDLVAVYRTMDDALTVVDKKTGGQCRLAYPVPAPEDFEPPG